MAILLLLVDAPDAAGYKRDAFHIPLKKEISTYLDFDSVRTSSNLLQHVQQLAWDLMPGATEIKATYKDDEGNECTLTERTANDALSFASPPSADGTKTLKITVRGVWEQASQIEEPASAAVHMEEDPDAVAKHNGYECNGCHQSPILGLRFRSLEWDDFDLCKACHDRPDRVNVIGVLPGHEFDVIACPATAAEAATEPAAEPIGGDVAGHVGADVPDVSEVAHVLQGEVVNAKQQNASKEGQGSCAGQQAQAFEAIAERSQADTLHQSLANRLQIAEVEAEGARREAEDARKKISQLRERCGDLTLQREDAKDASEDAKRQAEDANREAEDAKRKAEASKNEAEAAKNETEEARQHARELEAEIARCQKECEAAGQRSQDIAAEIANSKEEAEVAKQQMQEAQEARKEAEESNLRAQRLAELSQVTAAEEKKARQEAELAKEQAYETLTKGLQKADEMLLQKSSEAELAKRSCQDAQSETEALRLELAAAVERALEAEKVVREAKEISARLGLSASVQSCSPLTLGIEAEDDATAVGDATDELAELVSTWKARQAFRIGRIHLAEAASVPACARVTVQNNGTAPWPQTTIIVNVAGGDMGIPIVSLGSLDPGETAEIEMDLEVRQNPKARSETRSIWAIADAATGAWLGPLLVFEALCDLA